MAKYTVTCDICKEDFTIQLFGKMTNRQYIIDNCSHTCDVCKEKAILKQREEKLANAIKISQELNLVQLVGSEKQIAWAEVIRVSKIEQINCNVFKTDEIKQKFQDWFYSQNSAHWWIENRDLHFNDFTIMFLKIYKEQV